MPNADIVPRHPIRVVAMRTGLTPPTIRAWERRYGAVHPARSDGGQRLYSDQDLERLGTLRDLTEMGRPISMVAALPPEAAAALLQEDRAALVDSEEGGRSDEGTLGRWLEDAYAGIRAFDDKALERVLWRALLALDAAAFLDGLVGPLLARIGEGWASGELTTAHEHLASEVVDGLLAWMVETAPTGDDGPRLLVATLQGERHGLGARLVSAAAVVEGASVTYLGADLPAEDIADAAERVQADAVALSFVVPEALERAVEELPRLRARLDPSIEILVGGAASNVLAERGLPEGVRALDGLDDLRADCRRRRSLKARLKP